MQKKQGVSLMVLVITLIVTVILAATIIVSIGDSGVVQTAQEAADKSDEETAKEIAQQAWAKAYGAGVRKVEDINGVKGFKTRIEEALKKNSIDLDKYLLNVTPKGVTIKLLENAWVKDGFKLVRGKDVLEIGDVINYNAGVATYTGGWKVLGADENGNLLIMSDTDVKANHRLGYESTMTTAEEQLAESQKDWLNAVSELDSICKAYGNGKGTVGKARSITVEDVNAVTGEDPETYGTGVLFQYGNEVTYRYSATANKTNPDYTSVVTGTTPKALSNAHTNGFYYYNEKTGEFDHITDLATGERGKEFAKLTSNSYYYYAGEIPTISRTANSEAYQMIFGESNDTYYWLASPCVGTWATDASFGIRFVGRGSVDRYDLWYSYGGAFCIEVGVRAVVTLSSDIQFTEYTANGWSY